MNDLIKIESARVVKVGVFATGNGNNGPWAMLPVRVEWEYQQQTQEGGVKNGKMSAVVVMSGETAAWARDNVKAGNPYNGTPDMYLNLWVRLWGEFQAVRLQDGRTWEKEQNRINVEFVEIATAAQQPQQQPQQQPGQQPQQATAPSPGPIFR